MDCFTRETAPELALLCALATWLDPEPPSGTPLQEPTTPMSTITRDILDRATAFASRLGLRVPVLLAPMAGACPPSLPIAVIRAGGLGACGALLMHQVRSVPGPRRCGPRQAARSTSTCGSPAPHRRGMPNTRRASPPCWASGVRRSRPRLATPPRLTLPSKVTRCSLATRYVLAATAEDAPPPAPYPVQRGLTAPMRAEAQKAGDVERMQAWAGQSAALGKAEPAADLLARLLGRRPALLSLRYVTRRSCSQFEPSRESK